MRYGWPVGPKKQRFLAQEVGDLLVVQSNLSQRYLTAVWVYLKCL